MPLAPLLPVPDIHQRLRKIFPEGTGNRNYVTREMAAKTVFVMLYGAAVEGSGRWLRPDQVTRMTDAQAASTGDGDRELWLHESMRSTAGSIEGRWYAANTREPIRDETLREGLVRTGAVKEREGLPTTSPRPRYALTKGFVGLFDPDLADDALDAAIAGWQKANLSSGALARVEIMRQGAVAGRRTGACDVSERGNPEHAARSEFGDFQGGSGGIRSAFPRTAGCDLVKRKPQSGCSPG